MSIDFERAKLLMDVVVSAGQHGPIYQKLASEAGKELRAMIEDNDRKDRLVTPPEGPENSAIERADGSIERIPPAGQENTAAGKTSSLTGEEAAARRAANDEAIRRRQLAEENAKVYSGDEPRRKV